MGGWLKSGLPQGQLNFQFEMTRDDLLGILAWRRGHFAFLTNIYCHIRKQIPWHTLTNCFPNPIFETR